eukprot:TRINITY_DN67944_c1_g1_i11.p1 TRINITY_DN67944_c1_g1~~TRINITY_DN67944_c1_g1_i11.p1  ORF type:complete len:111 (-),score=2.65 TRINITY_DN67944_c1_g1_i11:411-743(-)
MDMLSVFQCLASHCTAPGSEMMMSAMSRVDGMMTTQGNVDCSGWASCGSADSAKIALHSASKLVNRCTTSFFEPCDQQRLYFAPFVADADLLCNLGLTQKEGVPEPLEVV